MSSIPFYETPNGQTLLCEANYPSEVKHYLSAEKNAMDSMALQYQTIVELGCIDGRYSYLVKLNYKTYIGVDKCLETILNGKEKESKNISLVHMDALEYLEQKAKDFKEGTLLLFPFNALGNMKTRTEIMGYIKRCRLDTLISTYNISSMALSSRREYYALSKPQNLKAITDQKEVLFTSINGLHSRSISTEWLNGMLKDVDCKLTSTALGKIGAAHRIIFKSNSR